MEEKIKVLFISHSTNIFGAEKSLLLLLKYINRNYFEPIVVVPSSGDLNKKLRSFNIKTYKVKCPWWMRVRKEKNVLKSVLQLGRCLILELIALCKIYKIIRYENIDIIYTNTIVNFSGAIISFITKIPHIWHIREIINKNPDLYCYFPSKIIFKIVLKFSNKVICNSYATAYQFSNVKYNNKIEIIYNAVDLEEYINISKNTIKITGWPVAVIGALQKRKGQDYAIHAINIVKKVIPDIKLLTIGDAGDEKFKKDLKTMVSKLNISDNITFLGFRKDVLQILSNCKVLLVPSLNEPFGRVAIEAMALGIPVIASNTGGLREIIQNDISGYLIPPRDSQAIAKKLIFLYHHPGNIKKMGNNGRNIVSEKFSAKYYIENIENILNEVVRAKKAVS